MSFAFFRISLVACLVAVSSANHVRFRLSPDVLIELGARAKRPGDAMTGEEVRLDAIRSSVNIVPPYQRLLGDAMRGDQMLFARTDAVMASWRVVDSIINVDTPVVTYAPGSIGPAEAERFLEGH